MVYELREYTAAPGKAAALHDRFQHHTLALFAAHDIKLIGFWTRRGDVGAIVYISVFADDAAYERAWAAFNADPAWHALKAATEADGPLVTGIVKTVLDPVAFAVNR